MDVMSKTRYMSAEQAAEWYTLARLIVTVLSCIASFVCFLMVVVMWRLNRSFKNMFTGSVSGMIFFLLLFELPYSMSLIPWCGSRSSNPAGYPVCRSVHVACIRFFDVYITLLTNSITLSVAYALSFRKALPLAAIKVSVIIFILSMTLAVLSQISTEEKEMAIYNGGSTTKFYFADWMLEITAAVRLGSAIINAVGALVILSRLYQMNFLNEVCSCYCFGTWGGNASTRKSRSNSKSSQDRGQKAVARKRTTSQARTEDYPMFRLAYKLVFYPIVQVCFKTPIISYHMVYLSTTSSYQKQVVTNPGYVAQTIHVLVGLAGMPMVSIGFAVIFLFVQPGAREEFQTMLGEIFCWWRGPLDESKESRDTLARGTSTIGIELTKWQRDSSLQEERSSFQYSGKEIGRMDWSDLDWKDDGAAVDDDVEIGDWGHEKVQSLREASMDSKSFARSLRSAGLNAEVIDELQIEELFAVVEEGWEDVEEQLDEEEYHEKALNPMQDA